MRKYNRKKNLNEYQKKGVSYNEVLPSLKHNKEEHRIVQLVTKGISSIRLWKLLTY